MKCLSSSNNNSQNDLIEFFKSSTVTIVTEKNENTDAWVFQTIETIWIVLTMNKTMHNASTKERNRQFRKHKN